MNSTNADVNSRAEMSVFVRTTFGLRGTLRLHRSAFGADLLRAPVNVMLAPILLITRLTGLLAKLLRFHRIGNWLSHRKI